MLSGWQSLLSLRGNDFILQTPAKIGRGFAENDSNGSGGCRVKESEEPGLGRVEDSKALWEEELLGPY